MATPKVSGTFSQVNPKSFPKGQEKFCALCEREVHLQCTGCRVTFYCDVEHQRADWVGIHERVCQLLLPICPPTVLQEDSCVENQIKKAELLEIGRLVAQSKISEGKHQEALPAAQFCLRCAKDLHGPNSVQLVPAYLLLAEANLGLGNLDLVSEFLSQAEWAVMKNPECSHSVLHWLHRTLGLFNKATGNLEEALLHFANDIYLASEEYGLDSTITCRGYFLMADVFLRQGKAVIACSLFSEVGRFWHSHLTKLLKTHMQKIQSLGKLSDSCYADKSHQAEVDEMLRAILEFEQNQPEKDSSKITLVAHSLAMLWFCGGDSLKALGFGHTALQSCQLIPNHDLTESIQSLLQLVQSLQTDPQPGSD